MYGIVVSILMQATPDQQYYTHHNYCTHNSCVQQCWTSAQLKADKPETHNQQSFCHNTNVISLKYYHTSIILLFSKMLRWRLVMTSTQIDTVSTVRRHVALHCIWNERPRTSCTQLPFWAINGKFFDCLHSTEKLQTIRRISNTPEVANIRTSSNSNIVTSLPRWLHTNTYWAPEMELTAALTLQDRVR